MLRQTVLAYGKFFEGVEDEGGEKIEGDRTMGAVRCLR